MTAILTVSVIAYAVAGASVLSLAIGFAAGFTCGFRASAEELRGSHKCAVRTGEPI